MIQVEIWIIIKLVLFVQILVWIFDTNGIKKHTCGQIYKKTRSFLMVVSVVQCPFIRSLYDS